MKQALSLLDKASKECGSYYKLSAETGIDQSTFSHVKSGKRSLPAVHIITLARIAKVDPKVWLLRILQERKK